jgi:hypothetical protein
MNVRQEIPDIPIIPDRVVGGISPLLDFYLIITAVDDEYQIISHTACGDVAGGVTGPWGGEKGGLSDNPVNLCHSLQKA